MAVFDDKRRIEMVMRIYAESLEQQLSIQMRKVPQCNHSGQDPHTTECRVHGRVREASRFDSVATRQNVRNSELDSWSIISIDEHLLTGDLEEDISILSIVA